MLVDGSSYLYRAYHAMPDLRAVAGDPSSAPTGAIRGMLNMLQTLRKECPAAHLACVFDAPGPTFRDALYPQYKAHRPAMPEDLRAQIEPIHELARLLGWTVLVMPGIEADDVIGTLAHRGAELGHSVLISSGDKDLAQLVNDRVTIIDTLSGKRRDVAGVQAEFGVPPRLMRDFQALVGDSVDNVPGVPKVGPKTAAKWLVEYGSLDALMAQADTVSGAVGQNLRAALSWLPTARTLVTIRTDCDLSAQCPGWPSLDGLAAREPDWPALRAFYERYGFKSLLRNLDERLGSKSSSISGAPGETADLFSAAAPVVPKPSEPAAEYVCVQTWDALRAWMERVRGADLVALDTETTALDAMRARLVGISLCVAPGQAAYIPLAHSAADAQGGQLPLAEVLDFLRPWLEDPQAPKLGQHTKYDLHVLANHGITVRGVVHDTLLQSYVLEAHKPHNLSSLAERHLGRKGIAYEDLCGKGANQIGFDQVSLARATPYACEDADFALQVHQVLYPQIAADPGLAAVYALELACSAVLLQIERHGVLIDGAILAAQSHELGQRIVQLEAQAHQLAGQPFNLGSPKQVGEILFGRLGLPVVKKTATGAPSTDDEVLQKLAEDYPLPALLLQHRSLAKLKGTYTDKLAGLALPATGRVHTHYAQAVAVTGRLSSNEPNLQNIPVRTPEGRRVREAFVAPPGHVIASADYSQIELRIMAHLSGDAALLLAFHDGMDVHRATAAEIFGVDTAQVSPEQRRYAKTINFGLIYGMSAFGLARALGIDNTAAKNYIARYFDRYPGVKHYMDHTRELARRQGYVQTVMGRRLYLPEINSPNGPRRAGAERAAINAPMQGTAADLIKLAMVAVQQAIDREQRATRMIMQVHDELVFEVPLSECDWVRHEVPRIMAAVAQLKVPLLAEVGMGANWELAH
ncbi:MAG: DNA polymerase I [Rhodoferax sp.]